MTTRMKLTVVAVIAFLGGLLAAQNLPPGRAQPPAAPPAADDGAKKHTHLYGANLFVRMPHNERLKDGRRFGVEVYRDENNGNLVYITETGSISVVPGPAKK